MKYIDKLLHPTTNIEEITFVVLKDLKIQFSKLDLSRQLQKHPFFPSLLSIYDTLKDYNVNSVAFRTDNFKETLTYYQGKLLIQIKTETVGELFAYVYNLKGNTIEWYNPITHKCEFISFEDLSMIFSGYVMDFKIKEHAGEKNIKVLKYQEIIEIIQKVAECSLILFFPIICIIIIVMHTLEYDTAWQLYIYALLLLAGCFNGGLLLLHEYNEFNPIITNICKESKKVSCSAVLSSKGSKFLAIPWSVWGTAYFLGILSTMITSYFNLHVFTTIAFIHLLTLPYVLYSFIYQKIIVKQWCPLCLRIQVIILVLFLIALLGNVYYKIECIELKDIIIILVNLFLSFCVVFFLWKYSIELRKRGYYENAFKHIKYNPEVFKALLYDGKEIKESTDGYGIIVGNPKGNIHIIKVCNPYCMYCALAQPILQELTDKNKDIRLQMIFTESPDSIIYKNYPIDTFLSLYYEGEDMKSIFSEWYADKDKKLDSFKKLHHINEEETKRNVENAKAMNKFCNIMEITETPTIFINSHKLPNIYTVSDLKYFF